MEYEISVETATRADTLPQHATRRVRRPRQPAEYRRNDMGDEESDAQKAVLIPEEEG